MNWKENAWQQENSEEEWDIVYKRSVNMEHWQAFQGKINL